MAPSRKCSIGDHLIEEYYWAGKYVVYVDNRLVNGSYDSVVKRYAAMEQSSIGMTDEQSA